jgi:hypothetical protein
MIFLLYLSIPIGIDPVETNDAWYIYYSDRIESDGSEQALRSVHSWTYRLCLSYRRMFPKYIAKHPRSSIQPYKFIVLFSCSGGLHE